MNRLLIWLIKLSSPHMMFMYAGFNAACAVDAVTRGSWVFVVSTVVAVISWYIGMSGMHGVIQFARDRAFYMVASGQVKLTDEGAKLRVEYMEVKS